MGEPDKTVGWRASKHGSGMRERRVEAYLGRKIRQLGGRTVKLAPTEAGVPDRLVMLPLSRLFLVELKAPGGRVRPIQQAWHRKAAVQQGVTVVVLSSIEDVDKWIEEVQ